MPELCVNLGEEPAHGECVRGAAALVTRRRAGAAACATLTISLVLLVISLFTHDRNRTVFGTGLGADWMAFYDAATILRQDDANHLYDLAVQSALYHQNLPGEAANQTLPYANAPFLALALRPLASLPYAWSYVSWIALSTMLFVGGLLLAWRAAGLPRRDMLFGLLVCLSFEPLAIECIHGGQISSIALIAMSLAAFLHINGKPALAGLALSICNYKPTLLPIAIIMLLSNRQWRVLGGFLIGSCALTGLSIAALGMTPCTEYLHTLFGYLQNSSGASQERIFRTWKFVDINSFLKLLAVNPMLIALLLGGIMLATVQGTLRVAKVPLTAQNRQRRLQLAWASAMSSTLVLNVYVGVYDTVLLLPSVLLTLGALQTDRRSARNGAPDAIDFPSPLRLICAALYILPWCSQIMAREMGYQPFTLAIAALCSYQYHHLCSAIGPWGKSPSDNTKVSCTISTMSSV